MINQGKLLKIKSILIECQIAFAVIWLMISFIDIITGNAGKYLGECYSSKPVICILMIIVRLFLLLLASRLLYEKNKYSVGFILSFPFVIQTIFMPGVSAYLISVLMILISIYKKICYEADYNNGKGEKSIHRLSMQQRKNYLLISIIAGVIVVAILFCNSPYNRKHLGLGTGLMNNFAVSNMENNYYLWPEDIRKQVPYEIIPAIVKDESLAIKELARYIDKNELGYQIDCFRIAVVSIVNGKKQSFVTLMNNIVNYIFAPITLLENCDGYGDSITGKRIEYLLMDKPLFGIYYMKISIVILILLIVINISEYVLSIKSAKADNVKIIEKKKQLRRYIELVIIWSILLALFANTAFDYILYLPIVILGQVYFTDCMK